jgi:two-component system, NtrC family, sensor kinase
MLRLWPIRTKLWITVSLLSLVLLMLSLSGLWGLYRYKHLASEVGAQAGEIPQAGELNRLAMTVRESFLRRHEISSHHGMIGDLLDPIFDIDLSERRTFRETVDAFDLPLTRLQNALESRQQSSLLVDDKHQRKILEDIASNLRSIREEEYLATNDTLANYDASMAQLNRLVTDTEQLLAITHGGMADFSEAVRAEYRTLIGVAWFASITAAIVIIVILLAFRSYVVKPFRTLLTGSRLVADGHFDHVIQLGTGDELSELAMAINGMTSMFRANFQDLDAQVRLRTREVIRNEQLASVGFLAAGVAHEINNPLAAIAWTAESLQGRLGDRKIAIGHHLKSDASLSANADVDSQLDSDVADGLRLIEDEAYRCKGIIEKLLDFSRMGEIRRSAHDLRSIVNDLVAMVTKVGQFRCKTIEVTGDSDVHAHCNPQEIRQVILNLITNALESVDTNGRVEVNLSTFGRRAVVTVKDNGCGMTPEVLDHLFEPFFTRRRDGMGTGLGLSITYRIVSQHGGSLRADSEGEGHGSTMTLMLPVAPENDQLASVRIESPRSFQTSALQKVA